MPIALFDHARRRSRPLPAHRRARSRCPACAGSRGSSPHWRTSPDRWQRACRSRRSPRRCRPPRCRRPSPATARRSQRHRRCDGAHLDGAALIGAACPGEPPAREPAASECIEPAGGEAPPAAAAITVPVPRQAASPRSMPQRGSPRSASQPWRKTRPLGWSSSAASPRSSARKVPSSRVTSPRWPRRSRWRSSGVVQLTSHSATCA